MTARHDQVESICQRIYDEAREFFASNFAGQSRYRGFNVLQGPPRVRPPVLFIGYQPGGDWTEGKQERERGREDSWPEICVNLNGDFKLAIRL